MEHGLDEIGPPAEAIVRVGFHHAPCDPPPWSIVASDLTFANRFDDARATAGRPLADCFRCIYFGSTAEAAFGEVLAGFQPPLAYLAKFAAVDDVEPLAEVLAGVLDFDRETGKVRGIIRAEWRARRRLCHLTLDPDLRFADLTTMRSRLYLRRELASLAQHLGIQDIDFSIMLDPNQRRLTQACAVHIHERSDAEGRPRFAGIRYVSRLNIQAWHCWALFDDRVKGRHPPGLIVPIAATDEALLRVARSFDLAIQTTAGSSQYLRP
ncbi:MAG: RES domain-containing protein [Chloroflexota bacterium]|nr:RES domain-containing protein [Chloroflexota bacterium]